jgi:4-hydroxyphenylpyruvate dioxygenase-like putative hemolysin
MATEFKWKAPGETIQTALSTDLNSLADSTSDTTGFSALSAEIPNETDLYQYIDIELVIAAQGAARATGAFVAVFISYALDGADYGDDSNKAFAEQLAAFQLDAATTARQITKVNIPIPPIDFKLYVLNDTGQAFAASGSTLKFRRHNEQGV